MSTVKTIDIECPDCGSSDYLSFDENYDDEWITLLCECLQCKTKYQINYRAVGIDKIKPDKLTIDERTILLKHSKNYTMTFKDLLKRDFELRRKYNSLIESEGNEKELNDVVEYLLNNHGKSFDTDLLPKNKDKTEYLADIVQFVAVAEI